MTEPKFAIGDRVAVCVLPDNQAGIRLRSIPETVVVDRALKKTGQISTSPNKTKYRVVSDHWVYEVDKHLGFWIRETCLRPIDKDEYRETEQQEIEQPIS